MDSEQTTKISHLKKQIYDYDSQIAALQRLRAEAQETWVIETPKILDQIDNLKRKASEKAAKDFEALRELLAKDRIYNISKEDKGEELEEDSEEEVKVDDPNDKIIKNIPKIKKRRNVYSRETKRLVSRCIKDYGYEAVQRETGLSRSSLKTIKRLYNKNGCSSKRGRPIRLPELDLTIREWIVEKRLKNIKITTKRTLCYARKPAKERGHDSLGFSWGWLRRFLKRHNLSLRKPSTAINKPDESVIEQAKKFIIDIKDLVASGVYDRRFVFNLDETGVATESKRDKTIEVRGAKKVKINSVNKDKESHTVLLGGTMTGEKLCAFMIFKGKGVKTVQNIHRNVKVGYREQNSWMDRENMKVYIKEVLRYWAEDIPMDKRDLLLIDNFDGHIDEEIEQRLKAIRIDVKKLPPNTTSLLQPMDISVNAPFKSYYADNWDDFQFELDSKPLTKAGKFKAPTREQKLAWVSEAWTRVSEDIVRKGFKPYLEAIIESENQQLEEDIALAQYEADIVAAMYNDSDNSDEDSDYEFITFSRFYYLNHYK